MKEIRLESSNYTLEYEEDKEWDFRIKHHGKDVTDEMKNNLVIDMMLTFLKYMPKKSALGPLYVEVNPDEITFVETPAATYEFKSKNELIKLPEPSGEVPYNPYTDVATLPDNTFFYVKNGGWNGFVTTENGIKVMYIGVGERFNGYDTARTLKDIPDMIAGRSKRTISSYEAIISNVKTIQD